MSSDGSAPARFIAGAICPECHAIDRIRVQGQGDDAVRECVACGFRGSVKGLADHAVGGKFDAGNASGRKSAHTPEPVRTIKIIPKG